MASAPLPPHHHQASLRGVGNLFPFWPGALMSIKENHKLHWAATGDCMRITKKGADFLVSPLFCWAWHSTGQWSLNFDTFDFLGMRHLVRFVLSQQCPLSDNPPRHAIRLPHGQPDRPQMSLLFPPAASASKWAEKAQPLDIHFKHVKPIYIYILPHHPNTCLICLHLPGLSRNTSECNYMFVERSLGRNSSWKKKYLHASYGIHVVCILACFIDN